MLGFIITRHVVSANTNQYWNQSYRTIRQFYPDNIIMIIDDNSDPEFLTLDEDLVLKNCFLVTSEFKGAGEILPYYYFLKYKLFEKAVILHDSVFFNSYMDFNQVQDVCYLWHFTQHQWDNVDDETSLLGHLKDSQSVIDFYFQKHLWYGCFGGQCVISYDFLKKIEDRHCLSQMVPHIRERVNRYAVERVLGCIFTFMERSLRHRPSLLGTIFEYMQWGYTYSAYLQDPILSLSLVKVWSER